MAMLPEKAANFLRSLFGLPLPVDSQMMALALDIKEAVALITTKEERVDLIAHFPDARLESVFRKLPPQEDRRRSRTRG